MSRRIRHTIMNVIEVDIGQIGGSQNALSGVTAQNYSWSYLQASFIGNDVFILYKSGKNCLLWAFSSYNPEGIWVTAAQRLNLFTLVLSSFFTFHLLLGLKSYNTDICLVLWFSCSKQMRKYTWAFSSVTHLKASWNQDPFCMCCKRVHSYCAVGGW